MTNLNFSRSTLAVATFLGLGALGFSSLAAHADVTGQLGQCRAFSKEKVVRCCEQIVKNHHMPLWMIDSHDTCQSATVCVGKSYGNSLTTANMRVPRCSIQIKHNDYQGTTKQPAPKGRGQFN